MSTTTEVTGVLFELQQAFEALVVRGLASTGAEDLRRIAGIGDELDRAGAAYLAGSVGELVRRTREADAGAPRALLRAQTASRVFERVLSLDAALAALGGEPAAVVADEPAAGKPPDLATLVPVLDELAATVEGLVAAGLTTASAATKQKLDASFKEASRLKLLRLAASMRYVSDELGRFLADSEHFSPRRLAFFANRTWLLARGLADAIGRHDATAIARLMLTTTPRPVKALTVAVVGVHKRALLDGSAAFEFRLRVLAGDVPRGTRLAWSCVFGARKGVPAEAFLHLPQAQKFTPKILLEPTQFAITDAAVDDVARRLILGPKSTLTAGPKLADHRALVAWDRDAAIDRIRRHRISPLDLEVELHEEIVIDDYELGEPAPSPYKKELAVYPIRAGDLELDAIVPTGPDGEALAAALADLDDAPPLYGLVHYEMARLVFQPLTAFGDKPHHLMIATDKIDLAALMKTLDWSSP